MNKDITGMQSLILDVFLIVASSSKMRTFWQREVTCIRTLKSLVWFAVAAIFLSADVFAEVVTYIGANGGDWDSAANWDSSRVPGADDDIVVSGKWVKSAGSVSVKSITQIKGAITIGGTTQTVSSQQPVDAVTTVPISVTVAGDLIINGGKFSVGGRDEVRHVSVNVAGDFIVTNTSTVAIYAGRVTGDVVNATSIYAQANCVNIGGLFFVGAGSTIYPENDMLTGTPVFFKAVDFTLENGALIDARGRGWYWKKLNGELPDGALIENGLYYSYAPGCGSSYDVGPGYGCANASSRLKGTVYFGREYGFAYAPFLPGSPNGVYSSLGNSKHGGGSVCVFASGHVCINGKINADGESAKYGSPTGGGIWIVGRDIDIEQSAALTANGGNLSRNYISGGAGGRISVAAGISPDRIGELAAGQIPEGLSYCTVPGEMIIADGQYNPDKLVNKYEKKGTTTLVYDPAAAVAVYVSGYPAKRDTVSPNYGIRVFAPSDEGIRFSAPETVYQAEYSNEKRSNCTGYVISNLTSEVMSGTDNEVIIRNTQSELLNLTWLWGNDECKVSVSLNGDGAVSYLGEVYTNSFSIWVREGTDITLSAVTNADGDFSGWAGGIAGGFVSDSEIQLTVDSPKSIVAQFYRPSSSKVFTGADGGYWETPGNWAPAGVPSLLDDVYITNKFVITKGMVTAASLTQSGGVLAIGGTGRDVMAQTASSEVAYSLFVLFGRIDSTGAISIGGRNSSSNMTMMNVFVRGDVVLRGSAKLAVYAVPSEKVDFASLYANATVMKINGAFRLEDTAIFYPESDLLTGASVKTEAASLLLAASAKIDSSARGYYWKNIENPLDPRAVIVEQSRFSLAHGCGLSYSVGGGYGGNGGSGTAIYGKSYGYAYAPFLPGSPNGCYQTPCRGGGCVWLKIDGNSEINGLISADGVATTRFGGPSGGGVWLITKSISVGDDARISAVGGSNLAYTSGGGGGRVSIAIGVTDAQIAALANGEDPESLDLSSSDAITIMPVNVSGGTASVNVSGVASIAPSGTATTVIGTNLQIPIIFKGNPLNAEAPNFSYGISQYDCDSVVTISAPLYGFQPGNTNIRYTCIGYVVTNLTTGAQIASGDTGSAKFTTSNDSLEVTWLWGKRETKINVLLPAGASAESGGDVYDSSFEIWVAADGTCSVSVIPDEGYEFLNWTGDVPYGKAWNNPVTLTGEKDIAVSPVVRIAESPTVRIWNGANSQQSWGDPANWTPANVPGRDDNVVIASGTCLVSNCLRVASLTICGNAIVRVASRTESDKYSSSIASEYHLPYTSATALQEAAIVVSGDLVISNVAQLAVGAKKQSYYSSLRVGGDLMLADSASLLVVGGPITERFTAASGSGFVDVGGMMSLDGTSVVYPVSEIYTGGSVVFNVGEIYVGETASFQAVMQGFGRDVTRSPQTLAPGVGYGYEIGAGYGGIGQSTDGNNGIHGLSYGYANSPVLPGSCSGDYSPGNNGAGLIRIHAVKAFINGTLDAHASGAAGRDSSASGGGIWLTAASVLRFGESANLTVEGGHRCTGVGASGAGGRIAIGKRLSASQISALAQTGEMPINTSAKIYTTTNDFMSLYPGVKINVMPGDDYSDSGKNTVEIGLGTFRYLDATRAGSIFMVR